jgi:hypothetical protein
MDEQINQTKLSTETCFLLDATKQTVHKLKMDIVKHRLHELDTKLKSAQSIESTSELNVCVYLLCSHINHMNGNKILCSLWKKNT